MHSWTGRVDPRGLHFNSSPGEGKGKGSPELRANQESASWRVRDRRRPTRQRPAAGVTADSSGPKTRRHTRRSRRPHASLLFSSPLPLFAPSRNEHVLSTWPWLSTLEISPFGCPAFLLFGFSVHCGFFLRLSYLSNDSIIWILFQPFFCGLRRLNGGGRS